MRSASQRWIPIHAILQKRSNKPAIKEPWKYGFKNIKSIVAIRFVQEQPKTSWNKLAPHEYGFLANVNPEVNHPRWSQKTKRRIGKPGRRETLMFNGYGEHVADMYQGMDLRRFY